MKNPVQHHNHGHDAYEQLTKTELRKQLTETLAALKTKEAELADSNTLIGELQAGIREHEQMAGKAKHIEDDLAQARSSLEELSMEKQCLQEEKESLRHENQALREEKDKLKERLHLSEENAARQAEAVKREQRETERQRLHFEAKTREMEIKIQEWQKKTAILKEKLIVSQRPDDSRPGASLSSFRLDLDLQEEVYKGIIAHLSSGDKTIFTIPEGGELTRFITAHRAGGETIRAKAEPRSIQPSEVSAEQKAFPALGEISELIGLQPSTAQPANFISCHEGSFQVQAKLDLSKVAPATLPLAYKVCVYARPLGHAKRELVGESRYTISAPGVVPLKICARALPAGTYRLQAGLACQPKEGDFTPEVYAEGGLVQIC